VFLNVVNQLILFAAALTATGTAGQVTDLAARPNVAATTETTSGPGP
jgi:membrane protein